MTRERQAVVFKGVRRVARSCAVPGRGVAPPGPRGARSRGARVASRARAALDRRDLERAGGCRGCRVGRQGAARPDRLAALGRVRGPGAGRRRVSSRLGACSAEGRTGLRVLAAGCSSISAESLRVSRARCSTSRRSRSSTPRPRRSINKRVAAAVGAQSAAFVPLVYGERVIAVLAIATTRERRTFSADELGPLRTLAAEAALALERARSASALEDALEREQLVSSIARKVRSELDLDGVVRVAVEEIARRASVDPLLRASRRQRRARTSSRPRLRAESAPPVPPDAVGRAARREPGPQGPEDGDRGGRRGGARRRRKRAVCSTSVCGPFSRHPFSCSTARSASWSCSDRSPTRGRSPSAGSPRPWHASWASAFTPRVSSVRTSSDSLSRALFSGPRRSSPASSTSRRSFSSLSSS